MTFHRALVGVLFLILPLAGFALQLLFQELSIKPWNNVNGILSILFAFCFIIKKFEMAKPLSLLFFISYMAFRLYDSLFLANKSVIEIFLDISSPMLFAFVVYVFLLQPVYQHFRQAED